MQRGQPIKGPRLSDLRAYSEHSWSGRERENDVAWVFDCSMAQVASHPLSTGFVSPIVLCDGLIFRQTDGWAEGVESRLTPKATNWLFIICGHPVPFCVTLSTELILLTWAGFLRHT